MNDKTNKPSLRQMRRERQDQELVINAYVDELHLAVMRQERPYRLDPGSHDVLTAELLVNCLQRDAEKFEGELQAQLEDFLRIRNLIGCGILLQLNRRTGVAVVYADHD